MITEKEELKGFQNEEEISDFLKNHSKIFNEVFLITKIGEGGESTVYRIETPELHEIVVKVRILKHNEDKR